MKAKIHNSKSHPKVAVDTVVFAIHQEALQTLLLQIGSGPYKDMWAVPGGLIQPDESPVHTAIRVVKQSVNLHNWHLEQLYSFGDPERDVRSNTISIAHLCLTSDIDKTKPKSIDFYSDAMWISLDHLPALAFDHEKIIDLAHKRLTDKLAYSSIARSLVPAHFTLSELQHVYQVVWRKPIDKRNFRKKMLEAEIISPVNGLKKGPFRPAQLFRFVESRVVYY